MNKTSNTPALPTMQEARSVIEKMADALEKNAANAERMCALLQPEFDAFEARTGHNVYVVRDYVDHLSAARTQRRDAAALRVLLASFNEGGEL